jgi:hypothetical protein
MTFLNPALWLGLLLAGVPILLHLLARRRLKRQPFPSLAFLRKMQATRVRRTKLRRWLLLALRTLALLMLALAFLRPALEAASAGGGANATAVLLDLSGSMAARGEREPRLQRARAVLEEVWKAGGHVALFAADASGERDLPFSEAGGEAPDWIRELTVDGRAADAGAGFARAAGALEGRTEALRELVWISDFSAPPGSLPQPPGWLTVRRINVASGEPPRNVSVLGAALDDPLPVAGELSGLTVRLRLQGTDVADSVLVSVTIGERKVAEGRVSLAPEVETAHTFAVRLPGPGVHPLTVEAEVEDALTLDDRYVDAMQIPGRRRVLVAGDDLQAMRYLQLALGTAPERSVLTEVRQGSPAPEQLEGQDVVLLCGLGAPDVRFARSLEAFVRRGGGVWLIPGDRSDLAAWSRHLLPALGFGEITGTAQAPGEGASWRLPQEHPVFAGLAAGPRGIEPPRVKRLLRLRPGGSKVAVRLTDGSPLLLESSAGEGRVWLSAVALDTDWTDWPLTGLFAPMVQRGVFHLSSQRTSPPPRVDCGQPLRFDLGAGVWGAGELVATGPLGSRLPVGAAGGGAVVVEATRWPGHYTLESPGGERLLGAANLPASERALRAAETEQLPGRELEAGEGLAGRLNRMRSGRELAGAFLLAALLLLAGETLLAREGRGGAAAKREQ